MELEKRVEGHGKRLKKELAEVIVSMESYNGKRPNLGELLDACEVRLKGKNHRFFDRFSEQDCKVIKHFLNEQLAEIKAKEAIILSKPVDNNFEDEDEVKDSESGPKPGLSAGGLAGKATAKGAVSNPEKPRA